MGIQSCLIDSREPSHVQMMTFGCQSVAVTTLEVGDLWLACSDGSLVIVERKTSSDLLSTLRDNRLFPQLQAMRERSPWCYLVICGLMVPGQSGKVIVDGHESGWAWPSVQGALLTVQEIGVHVVHVPNEYEFEASIVRLANRDRSTLHVQPARDTAVLSEAEIILTAFPGVGEQLAAKLLEHCGTAAAALWALTAAFDSGVPGLGPETKKKARRALGLPEGMELSLVA